MNPGKRLIFPEVLCQYRAVRAGDHYVNTSR